MYTEKYQNRKTFLLDQPGYYRLYLNEKKNVKVQVFSEESEKYITVNGYSYTGQEKDGSTIIEAQEATYAAFLAGMIRLKYTVSDELALHANKILAEDNPAEEDAERYLTDWARFQAYRQECKKVVRAFFPEGK